MRASAPTVLLCSFFLLGVLSAPPASGAATCRRSTLSYIDPILNLAEHLLLGSQTDARTNPQHRVSHQRRLTGLELDHLPPQDADARPSPEPSQEQHPGAMSLLDSQRASDFLAGAAAGVVFIMISLGIGFACRMLLCRPPKVRLETADIFVEEEEEGRPTLPSERYGKAVPAFTYTEREKEMMDNIRVQAKIEAQRKSDRQRGWWRHQASPQAIQECRGEPSGDQEYQPTGFSESSSRELDQGEDHSSLLSFGWHWFTAAREEGAQRHPEYTVTRLAESSSPDASPPWKRRSGEVEAHQHCRSSATV